MADATVFQPSSGGVPPGTRLNGVYEIERLIALGGMGEVYKGFNIQTGDPVAIKMVLPAMSRNGDVLALFRREASTLHNLQHEAIVRYFVFSVDPDLQRAYLAMEYVDGPSLATRLSQGPLSAAEVGVLFNRIAPALDEAHRLGVVHRDISSDNFILPDGDVRKAKLIDFGIARSRRPNEGTIIGDGFAGKYNYVSPEQLGLSGGEVTGQSDIYSFGLVLAEALRGRPIDMSGTQVEIIEKRRKLPDLSDIPAGFRPLLKSMLQPNPADRPAKLTSLAAFEVAGRAFPPVPAQPARRGGGFLVTAAVVLIAASLGAVGYVFRDTVADWLRAGPKPVQTQTVKPPPLGGETPTPTPTPTPESTVSPTPSPTPTGADSGPTPTPTPTATKTPGLADLLDELPPRPPAPQISLPAATVGAPYSAGIPAFSDPGHKGLKLRADALPEGLTFIDKGDGSGEISGVPSKPGSTTFFVTATNHNGRSAKIPASIVVAASASKPTPSPSPSVSPPQAIAPLQAEVTLSDAVAGRDYSAMLPPFAAGPDAQSLTLSVKPNIPDGLKFVDAGGGFSRISGAPTRPGAYSFDIVASNAKGGSGRMSVKLLVAAAPVVATPTPSPVASPPPIQAAQTSVKLEDATAGQGYSAALPPFRAGPGLALHVDPELPDGLQLVDGGGGVGRLAGRPTRPGAYHFNIVATDSSGASGRISVDLTVAPAAAPTPTPTPAPATPAPILPTQADVALEAVAGRDFSATLPPFHAGQGLTLHSEPNPPEGLTFADSGGGIGVLSGKPDRAGAYHFDVVALDGKGGSGRMSVELNVAPAPAPTAAPHTVSPSQAEVTLDDAVAGQDYVASLPPFRASPDANGLALHTEPNPPDGLTFSDQGAGFSQLSGRAARAGSVDFVIIARDASGASARMRVRMIVSPAPLPVQTPAPDPDAKARAMLAKYAGGLCFVARQLGDKVEAVGSDRAQFSRLEAAFKRDIGVEPDISAKVIVPAECPALALMKLSAEGEKAAPSIELDTLEVGSAHPLAGSVHGLAGRRLALLAIDNDGQAHMLPSVVDGSGDAANFSIALSGDSESIGPLQILMAIASDEPFAALEHYRPGPIADLAARLRTEWGKAGGVADAVYFKLTK